MILLNGFTHTQTHILKRTTWRSNFVKCHKISGTAYMHKILFGADIFGNGIYLIIILTIQNYVFQPYPRPIRASLLFSSFLFHFVYHFRFHEMSSNPIGKIFILEFMCWVQSIFYPRFSNLVCVLSYGFWYAANV